MSRLQNFRILVSCKMDDLRDYASIPARVRARSDPSKAAGYAAFAVERQRARDRAADRRSAIQFLEKMEGPIIPWWLIPSLYALVASWAIALIILMAQ